LLVRGKSVRKGVTGVKMRAKATNTRPIINIQILWLLPQKGTNSSQIHFKTLLANKGAKVITENWLTSFRMLFTKYLVLEKRSTSLLANRMISGDVQSYRPKERRNKSKRRERWLRLKGNVFAIQT
jgi:hypothetical protein